MLGFFWVFLETSRASLELSLKPRQALSLESFCLSLRNGGKCGITGVSHHAGLVCGFGVFVYVVVVLSHELS